MTTFQDPIIADAQLSINSTWGLNSIIKTGSFITLGTENIVLCSMAPGTYTATLSSIPTNNLIWIKMACSGCILSIVPSSGTIDGAASLTLAAPYQGVLIQWDGTNYNVLADVNKPSNVAYLTCLGDGTTIQFTTTIAPGLAGIASCGVVAVSLASMYATTVITQNITYFPTTGFIQIDVVELPSGVAMPVGDQVTLAISW